MESSTSPSGGGFWKGITALAGLITAGAALIGALAAIGVFDGTPSVADPTTTATQPTTLPTTTTEPTTTSRAPSTIAPTEPDRVAVNLAYPGDFDRCLLSLTVDIGDRTAVPIGSVYPVEGVAVGPQDYAISGTIQCPTFGWCAASGSGVIDVVGGRTFFVSWRNVAVGLCDVDLQA